MQGLRLNPYLEDPGNVPGKGLHGRSNRPCRRLDILTEIIPSPLLQLIAKGEEGLRVRGGIAPEPERMPTPLIEVEPHGDKAATPQDGPRFCAHLDQGVGSPAASASGTAAIDVLGFYSAKEAGLRLPTSATTAAFSSWSGMGRSGTTTSGGASAIPTSAATDGSADESATAPARVDAGTGNKSAGLEAASVASPGMMAAPAEGSAWEACPMATRAAWTPRSKAPCAEASQPAWHATAPAAEASLVLRAFLGARPAKPCHRLLEERERKQDQDTQGKKPKQRYSQILTRSGPRPVVPAGRPLGPQSPQALPTDAPTPASAPLPSRTLKALKGRPA
jgi:hypothetical protein